MQALRGAVVAVTVAVLAAGCGDDVRTTSGSPPPPATTGDAEVAPLLRVEHVGGFLPVGAGFAQVPQLTVYPDGRAVTHGPQILVFPGPALPNLLVHDLDRERLETLERLAADAGLLSDPPDYGSPPVADAPTTVVTLRFGDGEVVHEARALGLGEDPRSDPPALDIEARDARRALTSFLDAASALVVDAGEGAPYEPEAFAVLALPVPEDEPPREPGREPDVVPRPLDDVGLAAAEECALVTGDAAQTLHATLREATQLTRFRQGEQVYDVFARPLLPGEHECPAPGPAGP